MCSRKGFTEEVTFELNLESCIGVYQVKKESKGKQGTENYVTSSEEGRCNLGSWFECKEHVEKF